jgi:predicted HTH domain antitoxin
MKNQSPRGIRAALRRSSIPISAYKARFDFRTISDIKVKAIIQHCGSVPAIAEYVGLSAKDVRNELNRRKITLASVLDWTEGDND